MKETTQAVERGTVGRKTFGMGGLARMLILSAFAALMAITLVASVGTRDAQAAMGNDAQRKAVLNEAYRLDRANQTTYKMGFPDPCNQYKADCECFNRLTYKKAGISLNHTLWGQINQGKVTGSPRPGDLVFFDSNGNGQYGNDYDHTGVYVGNGHFIHSAKGYGIINSTLKTGQQFNGPYIFVDVISYK